LLAQQAAHWQGLVAHWQGQPLGLPSGQGSGSGQVVIRLSAELTDGLLRVVPAAYGNHIQETLLTGLLLSWQALKGAGAVLLELEGHGREGLVGGLDVSRTVGWFTSLYPVGLCLSSSSVGRSLKEVKEQLRGVPHHGVGWGWWQQQTGAILSAGVLFNYLGQFDTDLKGELWSLAGEDYGMVEGVDEPVFGPPLRIISGVLGGELEVSVRYDRGMVDEGWVVALVAGYEQALGSVVAHCMEQGERELTPSDLSYSQLSIDQLTQLETHVEAQYDTKLADVVQLAPLQEGMAFAYLRQPNTTAYSYQLAYRLTGDVALAPFTNAINQLMERHAILRTAFDYEQTGELVQLILTNRQPVLTYTNISFETAERQQTIIADYKQRDRERGFDIVREVLFRIALFKTADQQVELVWSCHHLIMDGWSMGVLMADFLQCYDAQIQPSAKPMLPAPQYRDYVQWVKQQDQTAATSYWQTYLSGYDTPIQLPRRTYTNETRTAFQYESLRLTLPTHISQSLLAFGQANDLSVSQMLTTLWGLLMARYTNAQDVVFGEVIASRPPELAGAEHSVGLFLNTLPVRIRFSETDTLTDLMARAKADRLAATGHSYLPLSVIQAESMLGSELINQLFIVENYPVETSLSEAPSTHWVIDNVTTTEHTDYDLAVDVKLGASLQITLKYNAAVYDAAFVGQLQTHYEHLIRQFVAMPEAPLRRVGLLTADEKVQLTYWGADADEIRTPDPSYLTAFDAQVTYTPYAAALLDGLTTVDYRTLQRRSVQIANYLQQEVGIEPGDVVGVYMHRSIECVACLLGIMRAGAAFLPIDLSYPIDRVRYMLNQAGTKVALTAVDYLPALQEVGCYTVATEVIPHVDGALSAEQQAPAIADNRTAYVIFTSGSTGQPKGAQLSQRNLMNYLRYVNRTYALGRDGFPMGWFTSVAFDLSITTLLAPLLRGDSIRIFHDDEPLHDVLTTVFGETSELTMVKLTPAHVGLLNHLPIAYTNITCAVVGGEELQPEHVRTLWRLNPAMRIYNEYGPTETTVGCVVNRVGDETDTRAVGKPIDNTRLYILDVEHRMVPVGVTGELFIGGAGVGKGYINQPEQTAQRFIANPYGGTDWLYATGDQARWLPDGRVEYVGRKDNQLKIKGFRVETGEIEHQLARIDGVQEVCVLGLDRPKLGKSLVAYVVKKTTATELTEEALQQRLLAFLPAHMIPEAILFLDKIPLTVNGKIDRQVLPTPAARSELVAYVAPETPNERLLAEVLETILAQPQIGCTDNLLRLGLDSIRSVQVMAKLAQRGYDLSVATMFEQPYLGEWGRHLTARTHTEPLATAPVQTERVSADDLELIEALFN
ncbi:amino acid adenylation domain-containing protein, partial [Fibrella sp. WM1]|uniref:amino acid adenylation domain-containing protein n=1 Tax=Fibrella musci TaxID=3242485 RepID=UPI00352138A2